jgi:hypothetical protein
MGCLTVKTLAAVAIEPLHLVRCLNRTYRLPPTAGSTPATVLCASSEVCLIESDVVSDEGVFDADHSAGDGDKRDVRGFSCGSRAGTAAGNGVAAAGKSGLRRMGARPARLAASFRLISLGSGISTTTRAEMRTVEFGLDRPASVLEQGDHLPAGFDDQRVEGLLRWENSAPTA